MIEISIVSKDNRRFNGNSLLRFHRYDRESITIFFDCLINDYRGMVVRSRFIKKRTRLPHWAIRNYFEDLETLGKVRLVNRNHRATSYLRLFEDNECDCLVDELMKMDIERWDNGKVCL